MTGRCASLVAVLSLAACDAKAPSVAPDLAPAAPRIGTLRSASGGHVLRAGGLTDGGTRVLARVEDRWQPLPPGGLGAEVGPLDESARIDLDDGTRWLWMSFATDKDA